MSGEIPQPLQRLIANIEQVVVGQRRTIEMIVCALLAQGHVLIQDVPGVGKTTLTRARARSINARFSRIQFTPDLLPSDVTGASIYHQDEHRFEFRQGPIFAEIVLADKINRTTPRTQSCLLEAMQEHAVTVDGITHTLPELFVMLPISQAVAN